MPASRYPVLRRATLHVIPSMSHANFLLSSQACCPSRYLGIARLKESFVRTKILFGHLRPIGVDLSV